MNAKTEQKERTRENILCSAARVLREKGIIGARVADVMGGAGLTVGGFYAHFDTKEALVNATIRRTAAIMRARLFARINEKPTDARAEVLLKRYLSTAHRDEVSEGCPMPSIASEVGTVAPEHGAVLSEELETLVTEFAALLPAEGSIPRRQRALACVAMMVGGLTLARATRGTSFSDDMLRACRAFGKHALESAARGPE